MQKPAKDVKVLEWWKVNQKELPLLAAMARKYLCPPVTSCSSERLFSLGGNIISDKRHNMKPETLQKIMFIKENFPLVKSKIRSRDKKNALVNQAISLNLYHPPLKINLYHPPLKINLYHQLHRLNLYHHLLRLNLNHLHLHQPNQPNRQK